MLKISLIAPTSLPSRRANTIQVMKMAQGIRACGHEVILLSPRPSTSSWREPSWDTLAQHYGLRESFPIRWLPASPQWRSYDFGFRSVLASAEWGAELIFTRHPQAAAFASLRGLPTILEVHDFPQGSLGPILFRAYCLGRGAHRLVSISEALLNDLENQFNIPARTAKVIAPDGVDIERYTNLPEPSAARQALNLPKKFTVGYTGHLYPGRGIDQILKIAASLPQITFLIAGGNPEDVTHYRSTASELQNIVFTGFVANTDLPLYQAACEVLLMPYQQKIEASSGGDIAAYLSPMKLFEYLASGRAIISSDLPVLMEVLDRKNALLLSPDDVEGWIRAIQHLANSESTRIKMGDAARQTALSHTWQARVERIFGSLG